MNKHDIRADIRKRHAAGESAKDLGKAFGLGRPRIYQIIRGEAYMQKFYDKTKERAKAEREERWKNGVERICIFGDCKNTFVADTWRKTRCEEHKVVAPTPRVPREPREPEIRICDIPFCDTKFLSGQGKGRLYCDEHYELLKGVGGRERTREVVRIRDKHTCGDCQRVWKKGERRFDVHHLNGLCGMKSRKYDGIDEIDGLATLCHKCHMGNHVREKIRSQKKKLTKEKIEAARILRATGMSYEKIADAIGSSGVNVRKHLLKEKN